MIPAAGRRALKSIGSTLFVLTLAWSAVARADGAPALPAGGPPNANISPQANPASLFPPGKKATVGVGFGQMDHGSWYFQLTPRLEFDLGKIGFAIQSPVNLLVYDPNKSQIDRKAAYGGVLRSTDWPTKLNADTIGHYLAILRMFRFGEKQDPFFIQYGEFYGETIGHGTIVDRYNNALELGNPKPGLGFGFNLPFGGIDLFTNNVATAFAPTSDSGQMVAGRLYVRPLGFGSDAGLGRKWSIGVSAAVDRNAPTGSGQSFAAGSKIWTPTGALNAPVVVWGVDTDYELFANDIMAIIPYIDLNSQHTEAYAGGLHIGVMGRFALPIFNAMRLWARLEYRLTQPGYVPEYFDSLYDVQRSAYSVKDVGTLPKAAASRVLAPNGPQGLVKLTSGVHGEATAEVLKLLQIGATYGMQPSIPTSSNLVVFATLPSLGPVKASAYYLHSNFDVTKELLKFDDRTALSGLVMVNVFGPIWVSAAVTRSWAPVRADPSDADKITGFTAQTSWNLGAQLYFGL